GLGPIRDHVRRTSGPSPAVDAGRLGGIPPAERLPGADPRARSNQRAPAGDRAGIPGEPRKRSAGPTNVMRSDADLVSTTLADAIALHDRVRRGSVQAVVDAAAAMVGALAEGRTVLLFGNGGSAADAQHVAAELVGRFLRERKPLAAIALSTDTSVLTAIGNDEGYDRVFARQIEALGRDGDVAVA